jgi:glucans biosynthesis protein C
MSQPATPERHHALDNLRALMMWLGIVIHVSANHMTGPMLLPWRDQATSMLADVLLGVIHVFRMPVFLILAGYFVALLVQRYGAAQMLRHRMRRLALPFAVFWPPVFILTGLLATLYVFKAQYGYFGLAAGIVPKVPNAPLINTLHLWFLYQLIGFALLTFVALWVADRRAAGGGSGNTRPMAGSAMHVIDRGLGVLVESRWGFAVLALPLGLIGAQYKVGVLVVSGSFAPPLLEWLHHGAFYAFGYILYQYRERWLALFVQRSTGYAWAGGLLCFLSMGMLDYLQRHPDASGWALRFAASWAYNGATWLWCFALMGLALRYLDRASAGMRYMADSSYWVYIVHMLGTIGFGALLYGAPIPAELKMLLNIAATTAAALLTYHFLVRNTAIGVLLNGRRSSDRPPAAASAQQIG